VQDQVQDEIIARLSEALAGTYDVEAHLGSGGMAYVYRAQDVKHDRTVAIKVLQPELSASLGAERFLQEIKIAAKLAHPHILPLYDSGAAGNLLYYVMPFVEGETLADLLEREKQLAYKDAIQFTKEVADALAFAHARGIVHRDIKPDNIYITGGHAVVADFGIARALSNAGADKLTQTGMAVGTPAYMSPEQAMGLSDVDGRSDIYSLGCVLYEMIIGQIPFTGPTPQAVMARHSMDMVPRLHIMRDTVPDELEDAVITAMAKSPADRYRTAHDFAQALDDIDLKNATRAYRAQTAAHATMAGATAATATITPSTPLPIPALKRVKQRRVAVGAVAVAVFAVGAFVAKSGLLGGGAPAADVGLPPNNIAVMYFDDVSPRGDYGHIADGITEGLIDDLSRVRDLDVISRNGVAQFRGEGLARDSIAKALGVGTLIEGRVDAAGDKLIVTALLVDGNSGADYDRATVEVAAGDFIAAKDSVVGEVSRLLRERLGTEVRLQRTRAEARNSVAWALYQQSQREIKDARTRISQNDGLGAWHAFQRADSLLAMAETEDATWLAPKVQRALVAGERLPLVDDPEERVRTTAAGIAHAERALAIDPNDAQALAAKGRLQYAHWAVVQATVSTEESQRLLQETKSTLQAAVAQDPSLADAYVVLSRVLYRTDGNYEAGLAARRAYEADAYFAYAGEILDRLFWTSYDVSQFGQAAQWCQTAHTRFPDDPRFIECQMWMMTVAGYPADVDLAWDLNEQLLAATPDNERDRKRHFSQMIVGGIIARAGLRDSANAVLLGARGDASVDPTKLLAHDEAFMRILNGEQDMAIDLLKQYLFANEAQDHGLAHNGEIHWWYNSLRTHPRFSEISGTGTH
jgi:eukaryotic-like serine/threonine-protein kinase